MSEQKSTIESFQVVAVGLDHIARHIDGLLKNIRRDEAEITKLNSIIDKLRDEIEWLKSVNREMSEDLMRCAKGGDA